MKTCPAREPSLASEQVQLRGEWAEVTAEILKSLTAEQKVYLKHWPLQQREGQYIFSARASQHFCIPRLDKRTRFMRDW